MSKHTPGPWLLRQEGRAPMPNLTPGQRIDLDAMVQDSARPPRYLDPERRLHILRQVEGDADCGVQIAVWLRDAVYTCEVLERERDEVRREVEALRAAAGAMIAGALAVSPDLDDLADREPVTISAGLAKSLRAALAERSAGEDHCPVCTPDRDRARQMWAEQRGESKA